MSYPRPMTSAEWAKMFDPAYNKLWGLLEQIGREQTSGNTSYTLPTPTIVPVVVYSELISAPYLYNVESTVIPGGQRRITKITWG